MPAWHVARAVGTEAAFSMVENGFVGDNLRISKWLASASPFYLYKVNLSILKIRFFLSP